MQEKFKKILKELKKTLKKKQKQLPSSAQWKQFFKILGKKEKILFLVLAFLFFSSFIFLFTRFYFKNTEVIAADGGSFVEGVVGQPRFINPVLANSDVDRDLIELLFAGLMKYQPDGRIVQDLAEKYEIKNNGLTYELTLKENIFWHDGQPITADDVIFTIGLIQDPDFHSPEMANWLGVTVRKASNSKLIFQLDNPYFPFLERLCLKIVPQHIFEEISAENLALTVYNLEPIGSGPFAFKEIEYDRLGKVKSLVLARPLNYFGQQAYLEKITFRFFDNEEQLIGAGQRGQVHGLALTNPKQSQSLFLKRHLTAFQISLPRYFAVFFNPKSSRLLAKQEVRIGLDLAINKQEVLEKALNNKGVIADSPILPNIYGFDLPVKAIEFNLARAKELFEQAGLEQENGKLIDSQKALAVDFQSNLEYGDRGDEVSALQQCLASFPDIYSEGEITGYFGKSTKQAVIRFQEKYKSEILDPWDFDEGTGLVYRTTRKKLNEICNIDEETPRVTFSLKTVNQPFLIDTANLLKEQWEKLGLEIEVEALNFGRLSKEVIKPREYEMLLFGEALNLMPDPFPFWHSSKAIDPGLNLALFENKKADEYLEKARRATDFETVKENLEAFQNVLLEETPTIFLYQPDFVYLVTDKMKGVNLSLIADPSKRFVGAENWHLKTRRVWK